MNDSHGYFESHPEFYWDSDGEAYRKAGGFARIATLFQQIREKHPGGVLTFDNGDTIHGTFPAVNSEGEALIPILNSIGFDAMTAHWEFAYGPNHFKNIVEKLDYPMLAVNIFDEKTGKRVFPAYQIIERNNLRIGVIGIAATIVDKTMPESFSKGVYFTLGNEELPSIINHLREYENVDIVIVVAHLGFPQELKLAQEVNGIDVLLSGHTHNRLYEPVVVNNTILMQSGSHGSFIGRLELTITNKHILDFSHELIEVDQSLDPDPEVKQLVNSVLDPHRKMLETKVGETDTPLTRNKVMESTMDNLLLKSLLHVSDATIAFSNGWRYGAPILPGNVTMNDLWNIVPPNPPVTTCQLSGLEIWKLLENNLEHTFSRNPYQQMGGYVKRCLGLRVYFKIENREGTRIHKIYVGNKQIKRTKTYEAAFISTQGVPIQYGSNRQKTGYTAIQALKQYLKDKSPTSSELKGTFTPI